jgi:endonuclease/exonuclease/phosphatase family metal-dependent hydrolase
MAATLAAMSILRIATLNCLNLVSPGREFYPGSAPYSPDEYLAKTQWLASMLDRMAADFVLLQEVFHEQALSDVVRQTAGQGRGVKFSVPHADPANSKPRLGLVWSTNYAPQIDSIVDLPAGCAVQVPEAGEHRQFSRPVLRARVAVPALGDAPLTLINVHLKSKRPEFLDSENRDDPRIEARAQLRSLLIRAAEAAAVRHLVIEATERNRAPLIVAGDFNDLPDAVTTQIVADTSWRPDHRPQRDCMLFNALEIERRLAPGPARDVAYTVLHAGVPERIDQVLMSEEFVSQSKHVLARVTGVEILNDHLIERRRFIRGEARAASQGAVDLTRIYSDHAAVCVSLAREAAPAC